MKTSNRHVRGNRIVTALKKAFKFLKEKNLEAALAHREIEARKSEIYQRNGYRFPGIR